MAVLLPTHTVTVWAPAAADDSHGWAGGPTWTARGSHQGAVQAGSSRYTTDAREGGDSGPYAPATGNQAVAYLDGDVAVEPGDLIDAGDGSWWLAGDVHNVPDPTGGDLTVTVVTLNAWEAPS